MVMSFGKQHCTPAMACWLLSGTILFVWTTTAVVAQSCPTEVNDEIQRCVQPVAQFAEALGVDVKDSNLASDRLMPSMGAQVFRQLCAKISTFSTCVRKAKRQCPNHMTLTLISASYGYLCTEGYDVFVKNADCLMRLDQEEEVRRCHDRTLSEIKNSSSDSKATMSQKLARMCGSLNYFTVCVEQPVLKGCGSQAWTVIARVLHDTTKTLMPTCKFAVPVPHQSALLSDAVSGEQAPILQSSGGYPVGRQKASSMDTVAYDSSSSEKGKQVSKNNGGNGWSRGTGPVSGAHTTSPAVRCIFMIAMVGALGSWLV